MTITGGALALFGKETTVRRAAREIRSQAIKKAPHITVLRQVVKIFQRKASQLLQFVLIEEQVCRHLCADDNLTVN